MFQVDATLKVVSIVESINNTQIYIGLQEENQFILIVQGKMPRKPTEGEKGDKKDRISNIKYWNQQNV